MKLCFLTESRYMKQRMPTEVIAAARRAGIDSEVIVTDERYAMLDSGGADRVGGLGEGYAPESTLFVTRNRSVAGLLQLYYLERRGARSINSYRSIEKSRNKAEMDVDLKTAGVPMPITYLAHHLELLRGLPDAAFPVIVKPYLGDNSRGLTICRTREELEAVTVTDPIVMAQSFLPTDGFDLKLYCYGETVIPVRKASPLTGDVAAPAIPVELTEEMRRIALACGSLLGLEIYGVDTIVTEDGIFVLEVNDFPNFSGIEGIGDRLLDFLVERARQEGIA
jgi:ribosomal protein S6--L-glutamate ligase